MAGVNVLVIEDAPVVRARLVAMLGELPCVGAVFQAAGLADASEALRLHAPQVVVIDLHLRGESGLAFIPLVRRDCPGALLVVVTNDPSDWNRRECFQLGVVHFFDKSRHFDDLLRVVASAAVLPPSQPSTVRT